MSTASQRTRREPVPYRPYTYLEANARTRPEHPALVEHGAEISFAALRSRVRSLMSLLAGREVKPAEVVAVALGNVSAYVALEIAIPALGAVIMPLPPALGAHEISSALERAAASLVITAQPGDLADDTAQGIASVREILTCPLDGADPDAAPEPFRTSREDIVQVALTSGTTGPPKLAAFSAELKQVTFEGFTARLGITPEDRVFPLSPVTQGAGEMFLYALRCGATLVMLGPERFQPERALDQIARSRATVVGGVPTMLSRMLECEAIEHADFSCLRLTAVAGSPLPPELGRRWEERTGAPVASFYGAMDIGQLAVPTPEDPPEKRWHTVGRPHERAEWAIINPASGEPLEPPAEGEICMRGLLVQQCYYDQDSGPFADDGWAHFGDLGFVDEDGYVHVTGRLKDTIIRAGNNVNPYEVEEIIRRHPAVADVAVVGRPDPDVGERAVAFVVLRPDQQLELEALAGFLDDQGLARYKWPEELRTLDELPLGPTGKVLRRELRERAQPQPQTGA
jgi:acyl-CoA synthetase (AMP-forming)/AMP-acid ligase II